MNIRINLNRSLRQTVTERLQNAYRSEQVRLVRRIHALLFVKPVDESEVTRPPDQVDEDATKGVDSADQSLRHVEPAKLSSPRTPRIEKTQD